MVVESLRREIAQCGLPQNEASAVVDALIVPSAQLGTDGLADAAMRSKLYVLQHTVVVRTAAHGCGYDLLDGRTTYFRILIKGAPPGSAPSSSFRFRPEDQVAVP